MLLRHVHANCKRSEGSQHHQQEERADQRETVLFASGIAIQEASSTLSCLMIRKLSVAPLVTREIVTRIDNSPP
jgi:hypothetical protein